MPNLTRSAAATGLPFAAPHLAGLIEREKLRTKIEGVVARLIDALDAIDGDPDIEGSLGGGYGRDRDPATVDLEDGDVNDLGEPWLGWTAIMDQNRIMQFRTDVGTHEGEFGGDTVADPDLEDGHDVEAVNEDGCDMGGTDNGIADQDGLDGIYVIDGEAAHA